MAAHPLIRRWQNLVAVPSYHYEPVFAQTVAAAFEEEAIDAVALELPEAAAAELAWADECWPAAVASITEGCILPFVPGDSILEGFRLARERKIPVHLVDLDVQRPIVRPDQRLPGPEFATRLGGLFQETVEDLLAQHPKADGDAAREAFMARQLSELLARHNRVLWIGGMAHWEAIVERLTKEDFSAPDVATAERLPYVRCRLRPSALYEISGTLPHLVQAYTANPSQYEGPAALQALALRVLHSSSSGRTGLAGSPPAQSPPSEAAEPGVTVDVVKMLIYARNLAATSALRESPNLPDLLTAASSTLGDQYAVEFYRAAMRGPDSRRAQRLPSLTFGMDDRKRGYLLDGRWIFAEPYHKGQTTAGARWLEYAEKLPIRMKSDAPYVDLPAHGPDEFVSWSAYPPEQEAYEAFVRHVLVIANRKAIREAKSEPFSTGLQDGIDIRATVRDWPRGGIHVRVGERRSLNITNGAIDYASESEDAPMLRGVRSRSSVAIGLLDPNSPRFNKDHDTGWLDPDSLHVGATSREATAGEILRERGDPCLVVRRQREFSFLSLDVPNWYRGLERQRKDFIGRVILPLAELPPAEDNLYGWLRVMFSFCRGKPFAYFSKYVPSARVHRLAAEFRVQLIHIPLSQIPSRLLEMHRRFRFLLLSNAQKEALLSLVAEGKRAWLPD